MLPLLKRVAKPSFIAQEVGSPPSTITSTMEIMADILSIHRHGLKLVAKKVMAHTVKLHGETENIKRSFKHLK